MKKILVVLLVVALALIGANAAMAAVLGSKHDLSSSGVNTAYRGTTDETCVFCHTPHGGNKVLGPLWNRAAVNTATYVPYGATSNGTTIITTGLNGGSLACMSCHDGQTAMGLVVNATGPGAGAGDLGVAAMTALNNANGAFSLIGQDLSNDHPVGVVYDSTKAGLRDISAAAVAPDGIVRVITGGVAGTLSGGGAANSVQCVSCHNPHLAAIGTQVAFLRVTNAASALCTACHIAR